MNTDTPQPTPRPWYRLHLSTWVFLSLVATVLMLIVVPGQAVDLWQMGREQPVPRTIVHAPNEIILKHGWPLTHLKRTVSASRPAEPDGIPWCQPKAWNVAGRGVTFWPLNLLLNIVCALGIVVVASLGFECWRRRRFHVWQFSLRELLIATTLIAACCGWWKWHQNRFQRERAAFDGLLRAADPYDEVMQWEHCTEYCGPIWLGKLVGTRSLSRLRTVAEAGDLGKDYVRECFDLYLSGLECWPNVTDISISSSDCTDSDLQRICQSTTLRSIDIDGTQITDEGLVWLKHMPRLRKLRLRKVNISDAGVVHLEQLRHLTWLDLSYTHVTLERFEQLQKALPNCEVEGVIDVSDP